MLRSSWNIPIEMKESRHEQDCSSAPPVRTRSVQSLSRSNGGSRPAIAGTPGSGIHCTHGSRRQWLAHSLGHRELAYLAVECHRLGRMEAAFVNTINPGDVAVIAINGLFGERMCEVASRVGAEVVRVDHEYGTPINAQRVAQAHPNPAVIAGVHAETSTGVVSDIAALGAIKGDALLITDAVTSIGGMPVLADEWGIDVGYAGTQKCIGVAPGLAPFTISDRAFERRVEKPQSWYLDLGLLGGYATGATGGQRPTTTPRRYRWWLRWKPVLTVSWLKAWML